MLRRLVTFIDLNSMTLRNKTQLFCNVEPEHSSRPKNCYYAVTPTDPVRLRQILFTQQCGHLWHVVVSVTFSNIYCW